MHPFSLCEAFNDIWYTWSMISAQLLHTFKKINDEYYYIIEYYHFQVLKSMMPSELSLRDTYTLFVIQQQQKLQQNTSTTIAKLIGMSNSSFSNHLRILERVGVVKRHRDAVNRKMMVVELTKLGKDLHSRHMKYFKELFIFIHSKLGLKGDVKLLQAILMIANHISDEPPLTAKLYQPRLFIDHLVKALTRIFFYVSGEEAAMLDRQPVRLSIRESRFLEAVYEFSLMKQATPTIVANYLGHPMSTVTSLVNVLEHKGMLAREENEGDRRRYDLVIQPEALPYIKSYMEFRVQLSKVLFAAVDAKTLDVVKSFFSGVKEYSILTLEEANRA